MLKKLLKYDFKAVLKIWWIAAAAVLLLSPLAGLCGQIFESERNFPGVVYAVAALGIVLFYASLVVFGLLTILAISMRFYKNFFTDEGYLTFTLPVTRGQLLNSKLIVSMVTDFMTGIVCGLGLFIMLVVGVKDFGTEIWKPFFEGLGDLIRIIREANGLGWAITYVVEMILIGLLAVLFNILFLDNCITFGCIVAKKAKVAASIAIYYVANSVFSFVMAIFSLFCVSSMIIWLNNINIGETAMYALVALLLFAAVALMALLCSALYTLLYWMLDRKLNLA